MSKTGQQYLESIRDGREVYINGELVKNHVDHPAFKNAIRTVAGMYDYQHANQDLMTFKSPGNGKQVGISWQIPCTQDDMNKRAEASLAWARLSSGWLGRSPDQLPSCFAGMMAGIEVFESYDPKRAAALKGYYEWARDNDITMTYTIVNPQGDRSKDVGAQGDKYHTLCVVDEDHEGITVRGAKMLGTSATMAQECLVGVQNPLKPDDLDYALSFAVPMNAKGLKTLSRRSYEQAATSEFDYPLSTRFDENDALVYFEDVKIPWSRVFVYKRPDMCGKMFHGTGAEVLFQLQSQARLAVKMQYLLGIARRVTETTGVINFPPVQDVLGRLASTVMTFDAAFRAIVGDPVRRGDYLVPRADRIYAATAQGQLTYPGFITDLRNLVGGGVIMLPSSVADFANPEMAKMIAVTQRSSVCSPAERVKVMKLAWDSIGSEFASRHTQYEMFYAGPSFVQHLRCFGTYNWNQSTALVDDILKSYQTPNIS